MALLDLYQLFVNDVAGTAWIFIALALAGIFYFAAKFRFPNSIMLMIMVLFFLMVGALVQGILGILAIILIFGFAAWVIIRAISRSF
jgi:hypothetical protein